MADYQRVTTPACTLGLLSLCWASAGLPMAGPEVGQLDRVRSVLALLLVLAPVVGLLLPARLAYASTITVTTSADDITVNGNCTLREAIQAANTDAAVDACTAGSGADTIAVQAGATYTLATQDNAQFGFNGTPAIYTPITIEGNGATITRGGRAPVFRLFHVAKAGDYLAVLNAAAPSDGNLTLRTVTLSNGLARGGNGGNGSSDDGGAGGGGARLGGAIYARGLLTLEGVTVNGSTARGGDGGLGGQNDASQDDGGGGGGGLGGNGGRAGVPAVVDDDGAGGGGG